MLRGFRELGLSAQGLRVSVARLREAYSSLNCSLLKRMLLKVSPRSADMA